MESYEHREPWHKGKLVGQKVIFETFVAAVHAVVGPGTPEPRTAEMHGFSTGKIL